MNDEPKVNVKKSQVTNRIESIETDLTNFGDKLRELNKHLSFVLRPSMPPPKETEDEPIEDISEIVVRLNKIQSVIGVNQEFLEMIYDRLEL